MPPRRKPKTKVRPATAMFSMNTLPRSMARAETIAIHLYMEASKDDKWIIGGEIFWVDPTLINVFSKSGSDRRAVGGEKLKPAKFNTYDKAMKRVRRLAKHSKHLKLFLHGFELDEIPKGS